jgi:glycosyltransferase involved in cell wall biosynthesis
LEASPLNVILVHPSLNQRGGAEKVLVRMIDALTDAGHGVTLYTVDKTDWAPIEENWGIKHKPIELWRLKNRRYLTLPLAKLPIILTLYIGLLTRAAKKRQHVSLNNYGETLPLFTDAAYIHSLPLATTSENPYGIPLWNALKPLYRALLHIFRAYYPSLIITNSSYNADSIKTTTTRRVVVLYPPVDHDDTQPTGKTPSILTASRHSKTKRLETIPKIAAHVKTPCHFHICLTTNGNQKIPTNTENITIHTNPTRDEIRHLRRTSTIYLSTQPTEALGLSILEAMDAGCIPLVPRDGGPWRDILQEKQGETGYAFDTPVEAARRIDQILTDKKLADELAETATRRARSFQDTKFQRDLPRILAQIHTAKTHNL